LYDAIDPARVVPGAGMVAGTPRFWSFVPIGESGYRSGRMTVALNGAASSSSSGA
jgi:hypothetical protein